MSAFSWQRWIFLLFCKDHWKYNGLVTACIVKTVTGVKCLCSTSEKRHCLSVCSIQQDNLAFRMARVDDKHLTLADILLWVGVNNSLKKIAGTDIRGKFCRVSVPVHIYNSLIKQYINLKLPLYREDNSALTWTSLTKILQ